MKVHIVYIISIFLILLLGEIYVSKLEQEIENGSEKGHKNQRDLKMIRAQADPFQPVGFRRVDSKEERRKGNELKGAPDEKQEIPDRAGSFDPPDTVGEE